MFAFHPSTFVFLFLLFSQTSTQNSFKPSITCYTKYQHEETKSPTLNALLSYSYYQSEITQYATPDGELCSDVGCACFSYRSICSYTCPGPNHFSECTDADRQNRVIKWHRGWTSNTKCEQMRQRSQAYLDLTCCYTDRCNDQPGKVIKIVDSNVPSQLHEPYRHQTPQSLPISHRPSSHYDNYVRLPTTSRLPDTYNPSQTYERSLSRNNSLSLNSFSVWMYAFGLLFSLLPMA
jgi:hypothetical protein